MSAKPQPSNAREPVGPSTLAVHAGEDRQKVAHSITDPIFCASTYTFADTAAVIDFIEPIERLRSLGHGYRLEVHIVIWESDGVVKLPVGAAFRQGQDWAVFVEQGGRAKLRRIKVGQGIGVEFEVTSGVEPGARVILHPSERVSDGVRIVARDSL